MKAVVYKKFGRPEVLQIKEVSKPVPKDNEILVRVHASPVSFGDRLVRNFRAVTPKKFHMPLVFWLIGKIYFGFTKPRVQIPGSEFAGEVAATGKDVKKFKTGDEVYGYSGPKMGAYAEFLCMPESGVMAIKPRNMNYADSSAVPYGALMALSLLRKIKLRAGDKVLVNGASGGIGPAVVELAKFRGARVTGVCSTLRMEYVRSLGAEKVIDYTIEDFTKSEETYNYIIDILGKRKFSEYRNSLNNNGKCILVSFKMKQVFLMLWTSLFSNKKIICIVTTERSSDLDYIRELTEGGNYKTVIDKCFPLEQAAEAHIYADSGHKKGSVVITF